MSGRAEDRARGGTERLRRERVGAAVRERDAGAERIGRPEQGADVARGRTAARARGTCSRGPVGRSARRYTPIARAGCGSVETRASSSSSTVSPATSRCTGSMPAPRAASTRSSPSTAKSPVSSRCLRWPSSLRTSLSVSLSREVITAASRVRCRGDRLARRTRAGPGQTRSSSSKTASPSRLRDPSGAPRPRRAAARRPPRPRAPRRARARRPRAGRRRRTSRRRRSARRRAGRRGPPAGSSRSHPAISSGGSGIRRSVSTAASSRAMRSSSPGQTKLRSRR